MSERNVHLFYSEGSSDKEYLASIVSAPDGNGYVVNFAFGRRGSALKHGSKTNHPVSLAEAEKIYEKLVREKTSKGYTPCESGARFVQTKDAGNDSGITCQLLNPLDDIEVENFLRDDAWIAQEKFDGERRLVRHGVVGTQGINRRGLLVPLPASVAAACNQDGRDFVIDGELVGDTLQAFDLLELDGADMRQLGFSVRYGLLETLAIWDNQAIKIAPLAIGAGAKRKMLDDIRSGGREGLVFKQVDAPYTPGRPASGGTQRKLKFTATASLIVTAINAGRSVAISAIDLAGEEVPVGNVTVPANHDIPTPGTIIEVEYLYWYPKGSLFQPVLLGRRSDISREECLITQLKAKPDISAAA